MPHLPKLILVELQDHSILELVPKVEEKVLSGVSEKRVYVDRHGNEFFVKEAKPRTPMEIFKNDPYFNELIFHRRTLLGEMAFGPVLHDKTSGKHVELSVTDRALLDLIEGKLHNYQRHVDELVLINAALEVIASYLCKSIMGDMMVTPHNFLYLHEGHPLIISPSVGTLREFLSEHLQVKNATRPEYWIDHLRPCFKSLVTTEEEARLLGRAYGCALLFHHNDLLNNINFSNFGNISEYSGSIVDWGNSIGVGFNGLTAEESAFSNQQFKNSTVCLDSTPCDIMSFKHMMPFDSVVYPLLPRQIAPDLFDLSAEDCPTLRAAQRLGFYEACDQALSRIEHVQEITASTIKHTLQSAMSAADAARIFPLLPNFITSETTSETEGYTLANIIAGRILSLQQMKTSLHDGQKLYEIASERLKVIATSQTLRSLSFFATAKASDQESSPPMYRP